MGNYESNPNQRRITTHKEPTNDMGKGNYYTKINLNALRKAMSTLTPKAFEMWMYFSKNIDNHQFWLSKVDFLSWSVVKETSYHNAFKELVRLKYLVEDDEKKNHYDFYEIPKEEEEIMITIHKENKEFVF